jgi:hypothetical protein
VSHRVTVSPRVWPRERFQLLTAVVLLLAVGLRVGWPTLTEFKFSEARLEALALEVTRGGRLPLVGVPSSAGFDHAPISVYLYVPPFLATTNPIPATVYGGLMGAAAVVLCWWLARRWPGGGPRAALLAALLFAVNPWAVAFSRKIWQVVFVPLLTIAFVGLVISALIDGRRFRLAWALVVYALLVQVHPSAVSLAPALVLWLIVFWREVSLLPLLVGGGLGALSSIPFLIHQFEQGWPVLAALKGLPEAVWDLSAIRLAWEAITGRGIHALAGSAYPLLEIVPQLGWLFNLLGWFAAGAVIWLAWRTAAGWRASDIEARRQTRIDLILLLWLIVPVVFNLRHSLDLHLHFFVLVIPAAHLIVGRGVDALVRSCRVVAVRLAAGGAVGLLTLAQMVALVLMARFLATQDTPGGFGTPLSSYLEVADQTVKAATQEGAHEALVVARGDSVVVDELPAIFDVLLRDRIPYRFVDGRSAALFPPHRALVLLAPEAGEAAEWYRAWPSTKASHGYQLVALDGSWPREGFEPVTGPRVFQNGVELQNYIWRDDTAPAGRIGLWLLWQVLWLDPDDTHFFVHLLDSEGKQHGQRDAVGYPTAYRRRGDRVLSEFDITILEGAMPGPYWAEIGLYYFPEVFGLPVVDGAGNPVAATVVVGPRGGGP